MRVLAVLLFCSWFTLATHGAAIPFPHEQSDLKPDPLIKFGKLPNGMRYAVRPNKEPKERVSLRLLVEAGALHETDQQQGLAHFLEHMAFNGSENFAPDTLIEFFQRMGMNFGGDTNASTWYQRTLYLLQLPDTKETTLSEGLKVFIDYAGGLLLKPEEINKERGIILSEKRTRDSVGYRTWLATQKFLLGGTKFAERDVIGTTEILSTAGRDQFLDFYNTWYRPELMSVVVVGDIDPVAMEKRLIEAFSGLKPRGPGRPKPDLGRIAAREGVQTFHHYESEAPSTNVTISTITPYTKEPDTKATQLKYLPRRIANAMINRRLSILAKKENAPFTGGSASAGEGYNFYRMTSIALNCRADQWQAALAVGDQELRRAREHGFQPGELKEVVANFRNGLEQAVKTYATRRSDGIADEITDTLLDRNVYTAPDEDLALYGPALEKITVEHCVASLREAWSPKHRLVMVTGNAKISSDAKDAGKAPPGDAIGDKAGSESRAAQAAITAVFEKSRATPVSPGEAINDADWAYADFGALGKVAHREQVEDLGITLLRFENGVRLNLKKTDFEANRIRLFIRLGTGQLTEPADQRGLSFYLGQTYNEGGLGQHSADDLRRILAGRTVGASFGSTGDAFVVNGTTNREDLLLQLQLMAARITDPGFRPEAARQARKGIDQMYLSLAHTASGPFTLEVARLLASGDHRFGLPPKEEMLKRNLDEVKTWVAGELAHGAIEIAIVGDMDVDATIAAVARTFGALPKRDPKPSLDELRQVRFPTQPIDQSYQIDTEIPKGTVALYWPTTDGREIRRARRLNMLSEVFNDRMRIKVREEMGDAYSPGSGSSASDIYPGYGYMQASVTIDPPRAKEVADIIVNIAHEMAEKGITEDELERARKPVLTSLRESARTNQYWLFNVLARAQERPEALDWARSRYSDNESITTAEITELAKKYFPAPRASRVIVVPQAKSQSATAGPQKKAADQEQPAGLVAPARE
ncbi:MAG: insulinase family protein [Opitutaceae bacterium]|nr:insulinase family protein [Opitutaceae bacterium]